MNSSDGKDAVRTHVIDTDRFGNRDVYGDGRRLPRVGATSRRSHGKFTAAELILQYQRSSRALASLVRRGGESNHEPALHELPSRRRPSDPG
jgi:hypothetical protein